MIQQLDETRIPKKDKPILNCAIYTRKSSEEGLEQGFNSLDSQREYCESFIKSQHAEGWRVIPECYDDGGFSGGNTERPGLKKLMADVEAGKIDVIVVYKIDRLSRSILDFSQMLQKFEEKGILFSAVTQRISTTDAAGRMMVNIIMSFAQYEREIASERIRDKYAAAKRKGKYCGGRPILGYDVNEARDKLIVNKEESELVNHIFKRYAQIKSAKKVAQELHEQGSRTKIWNTKKGKQLGGDEWNQPQIYRVLNNRTYLGQVAHKENIYKGEHDAIITQEMWDKAHAVLEANNADKSAAPRLKVSSPLRGVIRCGHCDSAMGTTFTNKYKDRRYVYYICSKDSKRPYSTCPVQRIAATDIDKAVVTQLGAVFRSPGIISAIFTKMNTIAKEESDRLESQKGVLLKRQKTVRKSMTEALDEGEKEAFSRYQDEFEQINGDIEKIKKQIDGYERVDVKQSDIAKSFQTMNVFWDTLFPIEQKRLIDLLVQVVEVRETGLQIELNTAGMQDLVTDLAGMANDVKLRGGL